MFVNCHNSFFTFCSGFTQRHAVRNDGGKVPLLVDVCQHNPYLEYEELEEFKGAITRMLRVHQPQQYASAARRTAAILAAHNFVAMTLPTPRLKSEW
ncbi:hypothetical protein Y032_0011g1378 [Ancylostoma ceylanicum]|uniref:Uncharacterized protein n=1 Tax=Ancylostoma ceylanicum TaxID=53326 RepID=A0A016VFG6_9BILA|nr:hypothetical protein Y032_0011g1378 [Ancylostoma ceylanicum]